MCMLGDLDLKDFLSHYIPQKNGDVLSEDGETIGYHEGVTFLTLGERHGFTITKKTPNDGRYYIVAKDISKNTVTVSQKPENLKSVEGIDNNILYIEKNSWVSVEPEINKSYTAQIRSHGEFLPCKILNIENQSAQIKFEENVKVASGQSIVFYDGVICLGGGIVK